MKGCTFFGHRSVPKEIEPKLKDTLIHLIEKEEVSSFFVGNHGGFDKMVWRVLSELKSKYPNICCQVVLAYMPIKKEGFFKDCDTIYPEGLETVPPRYAITHRNRWMLEQVEYVVTYVTHSTGGAAQFKALAVRKGKVVIQL